MEVFSPEDWVCDPIVRSGDTHGHEVFVEEESPFRTSKVLNKDGDNFIMYEAKPPIGFLSNKEHRYWYG